MEAHGHMSHQDLRYKYSSGACAQGDEQCVGSPHVPGLSGEGVDRELDLPLTSTQTGSDFLQMGDNVRILFA